MPNPKGKTRVTQTDKQKAARIKLSQIQGGQKAAAKASLKSLRIWGTRKRFASANPLDDVREIRRDCPDHGRQTAFWLPDSQRFGFVCCGREPADD